MSPARAPDAGRLARDGERVTLSPMRRSSPVPRARVLAALLSAAWCGCDGGGSAPGPDAGRPPGPPDDAGLRQDAAPLDAGDAPPTDAGPAPDTGPPAPPPPVADTRTVGIGPLHLEPGDERTVCVDVRLGNPGPVAVRGYRSHLADGSHHMIVYRTDLPEERLEPYDCDPFLGALDLFGGGGAPIYMTQKHEDGLAFPDGVAMELDADQMLHLEAHYIDATGGPLEGMGTLELDLVAVDSGYTPAHLMFWGTTDITVPPGESGSASFWARVPIGRKIFGLTTHTHQWGTSASISRATSRTDPGRELYRNDLWSEPPFELFDPPLEFDGSDGLRLDCAYFNGSRSTVRFGESANDEMCFFYAYYYPGRGFDLNIGGL